MVSVEHIVCYKNIKVLKMQYNSINISKKPKIFFIWFERIFIINFVQMVVLDVIILTKSKTEITNLSIYVEKLLCSYF